MAKTGKQGINHRGERGTPLGVPVFPVLRKAKRFLKKLRKAKGFSKNKKSIMKGKKVFKKQKKYRERQKRKKKYILRNAKRFSSALFTCQKKTLQECKTGPMSQY